MNMNQEKALDLVNKLLFGLQRARSASVEELTRLGYEEKTVKAVIGNCMPWLEGEKGEAFLKSLAFVSDRSNVTGMELYNFMTVIHRLDRNLLMIVSGMSKTEFPEPDMKWLMELGL